MNRPSGAWRRLHGLLWCVRVPCGQRRLPLSERTARFCHVPTSRLARFSRSLLANSSSLVVLMVRSTWAKALSAVAGRAGSGAAHLQRAKVHEIAAGLHRGGSSGVAGNPHSLVGRGAALTE